MKSSVARTITAGSFLVFIAACVPSPSGNEMNIDNDGGGRFSGHAGMEWSAEEIPKIVGGQVCGGTPPRKFDLRVLSGSWLFSGTC